MKLHTSHIFSVLMILLSFYFIERYGLDYSRYLGREIAALIISVAIALILFDLLSFSIRETHSTIAIILLCIVVVFIIIFTLSSIDGYLSRLEEKYFSGTLETTEGVIVTVRKRSNFSTRSGRRHSGMSRNESPSYIFYKYSVNGIQYSQGDKFYEMDKATLRNMIKNQIPVQIQYSIIEPQVSRLMPSENDL